MRLERFKEKDKKKIGIVIFTVGCIFLIAGVFLYKTFALFQVNDQLNMIEGNVQDPGDLYFAFYKDGVISNRMPSKEEGYELDTTNSKCNNGATPILDQEQWTIAIQNMTVPRTKCMLYFKKGTYKESILNGADPVIKDELIPVKIEENGTVRKADTSISWYNYANREWANAIILKDESQSYEIGATIPEEAIESYFVWIPRYRYQIFDDGNYPTRGSDTSTLDTNAVQTIQVVFESKDVTPSTGSTVGSWLTHPAFTSFNTNGMWVGKFETGKSSGNDNVRNGEAVQIKPNVVSWRNIQAGNAFYTSYDYKRNLDSHMMKNTEWGAVAYLQHSAYGSRESVRLNNNSSYVTGYAANNEPTCGYTGTNEDCNKYCNDGSCNVAYPNNPSGGSASTTGNISGIYDMAGGAWEYVMGVVLDESGNPVSGRNNLYNSGFNGTLTCPTCDTASGNDSSITNITNGYEWPETKYYDTYAYQLNNDQHFERRILGDATGEVGPFGTAKYLTQSRAIGSWYANQAYFVYSTSPFFARGSDYSNGVTSGVFAFIGSHGQSNVGNSFRVVLSPN